MSKIVMSSGHGTKIRGAAGPQPWGLDEVDTAIEIMNSVAEYLRDAGQTVITYTDTVSTSQSQNLDRLVSFHNAQGHRDLDVSIHLNAYQVTTTKKMGCECLYVTQEDLSADLAAAMAKALNLPDRGAKYRDDLAFLNGTDAPAVLLEALFCDAKMDCDSWRVNKDQLARNIADAIVGASIEPPQPPEPTGGVVFEGRCSHFGGPDDTGVSPSEGLAFIYDYDEAPHLFLPQQPPGTTGLARRLNPGVFYVACRWDYSNPLTTKEALANPSVQALVRAGDRELLAWPADWGPHEEKTGRAADLSPGLMTALGLTTDDEVEVIYPAPPFDAEV